MPILFNAGFVELINQNFNLHDPAAKNSKLGFAVTTYYQMTNFAGGMAGYGRDKVLAFYFDDAKTNLINPLGGTDSIELYNPLTIKSPDKTIEFKQAAVSVRQKYFEALKKTSYQNGKVAANLDDELANYFLNSIQSDVEKYVFEYFLTARARLLEHLPDNIINDERFKRSAEDARWNEYDETIKKEVAYYNQKFSGKGDGFVPLDWRWVKAMVWSEVKAGPQGNSIEWTTRPMQIGVVKGGVTDPGLPALKKGAENTDLIITQEFQNKLNQATQMDGNTNIKAGVAWLFRKACGDQVEVNENKIDDPQILTTVVIGTDKGFEAIANRLGTTTGKNIAINNPDLTATGLHIGQEIKYQKAHRERYISGWLDWQTAIRNYNSKAGSGSGDAGYMEKVQRAYQIITSRNK